MVPVAFRIFRTSLTWDRYSPHGWAKPEALLLRARVFVYVTLKRKSSSHLAVPRTVRPLVYDVEVLLSCNTLGRRAECSFVVRIVEPAFAATAQKRTISFW